MKSTPDTHPEKPGMPGEVERDNDALRPDDPAQRKQQKGHPDGGDTDAQKMGRKETRH